MLERALAEASRCKGLEGTGTVSIDDKALYLFDTHAIQTSPCLQLLDLQFALTGFIKAVQQGNEALTPAIAQSYVAISRKDYIVYMHEVEPWQWHFLKALKNTNDYNEAVCTTAAQCGIANSTVLADLMLWVPVAIKYGYIYRDN